MATSQLLDLLTPFTTTLLLLLLLLALSLPFLHTLSSPRQPPTTKPPTHVRPEWINFSFLWKIIQAARQAKLMEFFHGEVLKGKVGMTVVQYSWLSWLVPGPRMAVFTNDEANVRFLHAGGFEDWAVKPTRYHAVGPLLGRGIFTEDGAFWKQSRGLLRPNFEKHQSSDLEQFERHMEALFALVRRQNASGRLDLADVLGRLVMDTSAEFLMGMGTGALGAGSGNGRAGRFVRDMDVGMRDAALHWRLGWLYGLWPHAEARRAVQGARVFVEGFVQRAVEKAAKGEEEGWKEGKGKYVFIDELAKRKEVDVDRIRDEAMNVILAGMDTTAALLSNLWFFLVRNQEVWEKLKAEVDALEGELPTYEKLRNMKFIKYCAQETLRLFPPAPLLAKIAIRPTTLPHGGGPDGKSPIFIPKGATANYVSYSLMRSPEVYGPDPDTWRPSRWEDPNLRPGWSYLAFGGGPRVCLGQQYALTETYYVTIRLMQEFGKGFEVRDEEWEWREKFQITMSSANGVKVGLRE